MKQKKERNRIYAAHYGKSPRDATVLSLTMLTATSPRLLCRINPFIYQTDTFLLPSSEVISLFYQSKNCQKIGRVHHKVLRAQGDSCHSLPSHMFICFCHRQLFSSAAPISPIAREHATHCRPITVLLPLFKSLACSC